MEKNRHKIDLFFSTAEIGYRGDEFNLSHLFKLPYDTLVNIFYTLAKDVHLTWDAFNDMPWFWVLMMIDAHKEFIEKQEEGSSDTNDIIANQQSQMESMQQQQQNSMKNMMSNMPKFDNSSFNF